MLAAALKSRLGSTCRPPFLIASASRFLSSAEDAFVSIDRSGLFKHRADATASTNKEPETEMTKHLKSIIRFRGGPITLAEFMSEVLTNPTAGYYTQRDVFGTAGDFTTSPEISQMFGEMIGIWCVAMWQQMGSPQRLRLVELGPGRGTLMADLLRGTATFTPFATSLSVALVEVSPVLRKMQWEALQCQGSYSNDVTVGTTASGICVSWHRSIDEVPEDATADPALYLAHEFLDALPVHQFQKTNRAWCERLVDEALSDSSQHFQMVLSPGPTPASRALLPLRLQGLPLEQRAVLDALEICPQGMALAESLAKRVAAHGGAALLIDYGQDGPYRGSLQAIKDHTFSGLFESPGEADLSAWVDFDALRVAVQKSGAAASFHGPITQAHLLQSLGIQARLQQLMENASEEEAEALIAGYMRLVSSSSNGKKSSGSKKESGSSSSLNNSGEDLDDDDEIDGMGESYQAVCIVPAVKEGGEEGKHKTHQVPIAFEHR